MNRKTRRVLSSKIRRGIDPMIYTNPLNPPFAERNSGKIVKGRKFANVIRGGAKRKKPDSSPSRAS